MTRDDILRMTREAHLDVYGLGKDHQKFMSAVECVAYSAFTAGALAEREACAKLCEDWTRTPETTGMELTLCAEAIRARSK